MQQLKKDKKGYSIERLLKIIKGSFGIEKDILSFLYFGNEISVNGHRLKIDEKGNCLIVKYDKALEKDVIDTVISLDVMKKAIKKKEFKKDFIMHMQIEVLNERESLIAGAR